MHPTLTPTASQIITARHVAGHPETAVDDMPLARGAWIALKAARGQRVDLARIGAPAYIIAPAHIIGPDRDATETVVAIDAARARAIPRILARIGALAAAAGTGPEAA